MGYLYLGLIRPVSSLLLAEAASLLTTSHYDSFHTPEPLRCQPSQLPLDECARIEETPSLILIKP